MKVVIIPCMNRPGFLAVTLGLIAKAEGYKDYYYIFAADRGYTRNVLKVIGAWAHSRGVDYRVITPSRYYERPAKQSFNIINAYRFALRMGAEEIHLIEDDIFVSNDYFMYHSAIPVGCSIASRNNNEADDITWEIDKYYLRYGSYQSLGVRWDHQTLLTVLSYIDNAYFDDILAYCKSNFPNSKIGEYFAEQDGLIRRILEHEDIPVAFPHHPRCYHAGFQGYNRSGKIHLPESVEDQVAVIKRICFSDANMMYTAIEPSHYMDSRPVNLVIDKWKTLSLKSL